MKTVISVGSTDSTTAKSTFTSNSDQNARAQRPDAPSVTTTNDPPRFLNKPDVARMFGVTTRTIESYMQRGLLPYFKIRHTVRFSAKDIEDTLNANHRLNCSRL